MYTKKHSRTKYIYDYNTDGVYTRYVYTFIYLFERRESIPSEECSFINILFLISKNNLF